ncbi:MAG: hypothetical protein QOE58_749 [Actinomycetota bacterium]|nr:hypothetical protein [Actinomycetota bacterium]
MDLRLTEEQRALQESVMALLSREVSTADVRRAESMGLDRRLWGLMAATGLPGIGVAERLGGGGGGLLEMCLVTEAAGAALAPVPLVGTLAASRLLSRAGAEGELTPILSGHTIASLATGHGPIGSQLLADGAAADVVVAMEPSGLVVHDRPHDVSASPARNMGGLLAAFWPGITAGRVLLSGPEAKRLWEAALDETRVLLAAALVGLARSATEIGAQYSKERSAFGQPIAMYQAVAHPFADALTAQDGAQMLVWKAAWALDSGDPRGPALASSAFVFAAETAFAAAGHSLHVHGGYGFMEEYDIQLYYRRAKAWACAFSDPERELLLVADRRFGRAPALSAQPSGAR